jgi:hypothetical protein
MFTADGAEVVMRHCAWALKPVNKLRNANHLEDGGFTHGRQLYVVVELDGQSEGS